MRLHRFFVDADLTRSSLTIEDTGLLHQWSKVLRLASSGHLILCDGKGFEATATITAMDRTSITIDLNDRHPVEAEPQRDVTVYCSVLKRENFEWVVQKCTEIGVRKIVPIVAARTVKTGLKMDRLRTIAREAAEQSGRGMIPIMHEPIAFERACLSGRQALSEAKHTTNLFYDCPRPPLTQPSNHPAIQQSTSQREEQLHMSVAIWIGPEGGWTEEEVLQAKESGFILSSLGSLILRAETAAIIGSYTAIHAHQQTDDLPELRS